MKIPGMAKAMKKMDFSVINQLKEVMEVYNKNAEDNNRILLEIKILLEDINSKILRK